MEYAPWLNDYDDSYARLAMKLRDLGPLAELSGAIRFGRSLKGLYPESEVVLKLQSGSGDFLPDYIPNFRGWLVVSERLKNLLVGHADNFEIYPVSIEDSHGAIIRDKYFLAHLVGSLCCMDRERSDYDISAISKDQTSCIRRLALDETKIPEGVHIFRLGECEDLIIVSEVVGGAIYDQEMTGIFFQQMEDFGEEFRAQ